MKKIFKILFAIFVLTLTFLVESSMMKVDAATSGTTGDCTWSLEGTVLTISGEGDMGDYDSSSSKPWCEVTQVIINNGVTNVGDYAFYNCRNLTNIELPESITSIGYCAFLECKSLQSVAIPDSVTEIEYSAFNRCSSLSSMKLPFIGNNSSYYHLGYIFGARVWSENNQYVPDSLRSITISNQCTQITSNAFYCCGGLTDVELPSSVTSIGVGAFRGCSSLTNIKIPNSVTNISSEAFCGCSSLASIEIPDSVTRIGRGVFCGCDGLTSMKVPFVGSDNLNHDCLNYFFRVSSTGENADTVPSSLKKIIIGNECTQIASYVFENCSNLTSIELPESITSIGYCAFRNCSNLINVEMPNSVASIDSYAFEDCSSLISIEFPSSITSIGSAAFRGCSSLKYVWYHGTQDEQEKIDISPGNTILSSANWHYNTYNGEHTYVTCEDGACEYCDQTRELESHLFSLNNGLTCVKCYYSLQPQKPDVEYCISGKVSLVAQEGIEYSIDGINWQSSNVFEELCANTTYIFYQRVKKTSVAQESESSEGLAIKLKEFQGAPSTPLVSSFTDTKVILVPIENGEYSVDKVTWQKSNIFENLFAATSYTFYQRYAETDTCECSETSNGLSVTTDKSKQTMIPNAPIVQSITTSGVILVAVEGCEYSKDGTNWQSSTQFNYLSCTTEYTFYQRYKETSTTYAGKSSEGTSCKTTKGTQSAPSCPSLSSKTHQSVTLTKINGYEYSKDGINWQTGNIFKELEPETNYLFYQRKAETDTHFASSASSSLTVRTYEEGALESISIITKSNKQLYLEGDTFDATGIVVEAYYDHTGRELITDYTISGYDATPGTKTIVVSYQGKTATFTVEVEENHNYQTIITPATLSKDGYIVEKCSICGDVASKTAINYIKSVSLSTTEYTYNGSKKTPSVTVKDSAGKKLEEGTDYTLAYSSSSRKSIGRYSVKVTFKGNYSGSKTLYFTIGPKNPSSVKVVLYGYDDVKVSWKKVSGASGYKVYYKKSTSSKWSSKTTTGTSVKLANLSDGVKYDIKVVTYKTVGGNKCYNAGKSTSIYTLKKITGVKVKKSGSKVKVSWSNISGETGYQISMSTKKSGTKIVSTYKTTSGKSKTISATKKKTYYYKVRAYKVVDGKKIYGPWSSVVKYVRK